MVELDWLWPLLAGVALALVIPRLSAFPDWFAAAMRARVAAIDRRSSAADLGRLDRLELEYGYQAGELAPVLDESVRAMMARKLSPKEYAASLEAATEYYIKHGWRETA